LDLELVNTMLAERAGARELTVPRIAKLTISGVRWHVLLRNTFRQTQFPHLEELALCFNNKSCIDANGVLFPTFLDDLLPSSATLRSLSLRRAFTHYAPYGSLILPLPLYPFTSLRAIELPLAHMAHIGALLEATSIVTFTFGVYGTLHLWLLDQLLEYLGEYIAGETSPLRTDITRVIGFRMECLANPVLAPFVKKSIFAHVFTLCDRLDRFAWRAGRCVARRGMAVKVGCVVVDFAGLYYMGRLQAEGQGCFGVEDVFAEFRDSVGL
jgi:hypothetical protein